jgi:ABC-type uncharacterized transport system substrate-binding protein
MRGFMNRFSLLLFFLFSFNIFGQNVLVLHSYHQGLEWTDKISEGIKSVLDTSESNVEVYFEYLDTKRNPGKEYFKQVAEFERQKKQLAEINFDVIIASDNDALAFLVDFGDELFPDIPIVFCGVNNFTPSLLKGKKNITGIREVIDYRSTLSVMKKLHPQKTRILLILDETSTGSAIKVEVDETIRDFGDDFEFEYYRTLVPGEAEKKIAELGEEYLIYILAYNSAENGVFISYNDVIEMISKYANVPIYGSWDFFFNKGILGGMITSGFSQGEQAALYAERILGGERPDTLEISQSGSNEFMFDYRVLNRFSIDVSELPEDSFVSHPPVGFFDENKSILLSVAIYGLILLIYSIFQKIKRDNLKKRNEELDRKVQIQTRTLNEKNQLLKKEIIEKERIEKDLWSKNQKLEEALSEVSVLSGLLPICSGCKKIRDDKGYWNQIDSYFHKHSNLDFSHGLCPDCAQELYPEYYRKK